MPLLLQFQYSHFASSFRVIWLLRFVPQVRLIMWTVIKSLEVSGPQALPLETTSKWSLAQGYGEGHPWVLLKMYSDC